MSRHFKYNYGDLVACYTAIDEDSADSVFNSMFPKKKRGVTKKRVVLGWIEARATDGDDRPLYFIRWSDRPHREPMSVIERDVIPLRKLYEDVRRGEVSDGIIIENAEE